MDPYPLASGAAPQFYTPTGKAQLYAKDLEELYKTEGDDFAPMPIYKDPIMPQDGEFRLLFGRTPHHSHARTHNNRVLLELQDSTPVWIHPDDAKKLKLEDGQMVCLVSAKTGKKSHPEKLKVTKRIKAGSIFIHHGFGHQTKAWSKGFDRGTSENDFVSDEVDPISGAAAFHNGFVTVVKG